MQATVPVARVDGPTAEYVKAHVVVRAGGFEIQNRRWATLATAEGEPIVSDDGRIWTLTDGDGNVWTVEKMDGCGCGGTKVNPK